MRFRTYKDEARFRHFDLVMDDGLRSVDLISVAFSALLGAGAVSALIATFESSTSALSEWVH